MKQFDILIKSKTSKMMLLGMLIACSLNGNSLYAQDNNFAGGKGTLEEPYQIKTAEQLDYLRNFTSNSDRDKHFCLMNDIDLAEFLEGNDEGWLPIGKPNGFRGNVHGNGYKIKGLFINRPAQGDVGLFGLTYYTTIDNLGVEIAEGKSITGNGSTGGLVGSLVYSSKLSSCYVIGNVVGQGTNVGGLVGKTDESSSIDFCHTSGTVEGDNYVGGLIGTTGKNTLISNSYSESDVIGNGRVGGLIGFHSGSSVTKSYATGSVSSTGFTGGFVGVNFAEISYCYSTGSVSRENGGCGGFTGGNNIAAGSVSVITGCYATGNVTGRQEVSAFVTNNAGSISNSYAVGTLTASDGVFNDRFCGISSFSTNTDITDSHFNSETTGAVSGIHYYNGSISQFLLPGNTTAEMMQQSTYENWDFETVWNIREGESYPFFRWETERLSLLQSITVSAGTLSPEFSSGTFEYTLHLPSDVDIINISGVAVDGANLTGDLGGLLLSENENVFTLTVTAENAPEHAYTITVARGNSGIKNPKIKNEISLYPNPVKNELTINSNTLTINKVEVIDLSGKTIIQINEPTNKINVSNIAQGVYFVKIEMDKGIVTQKFIKE